MSNINLNKGQDGNKVQRHTVIFDFDGTIANGEAAFLDMINSFAAEYGYRPITQDQIPSLRDMGAKDFLFKRLGLPFWDLLRIEKRGRLEYGKRMGMVKLVQGMREVFNVLERQGFRVGILSSNSEESISSFLKINDLHNLDFLYSGSSIFGKAKVIKKMIKEKGLNISDVIYIGDESRDVEACLKVGIPVIAVTWGLNSLKVLKQAGARLIAEEPSDIVAILESQSQS